MIASNRGPLSFTFDDGEPVAQRGAGGLVSGLGPLVSGTDTLWIAAALSDGDRSAAERGTVEAEGFRVQLLAIDDAQFRMAYDVVCNATLWFLHHSLFDLARRPRFDQRWRLAWDAYRAVNRAFAEAIQRAAPEGAAVLVQDYHLTLTAPHLRASRPDLALVHFSHTPFAGPDMLRVLPADVRRELLEGMAAHHACGFHTGRWARSFEQSCSDLADLEPRTFVAPLGPDADDIRAVAGSARCDDAVEEIGRLTAGRPTIVRVDRIELSKNLLRGFHAFDDLLARHPSWRERVCFVASCYPSREGLPEYLSYRQEVETLVRQINERWATPGWTPIVYDPSDDYASAVAALRSYDVLLVNPVRDGLNLVAKEGPLVNERHGVVALSSEAGVWEELEGCVREVDPYDVSGTADVLAAALDASDDERRREAAELRRRAEARTPADWLEDQVAAVS